MSKDTLNELERLYEHVTYYNRMSPFPIYDTEYVDKIKKRMDDITRSKEDYDKVPVVACKNCKSLHIEIDDADNNICMKCNSINELVEFKDIHHYKAEKNIWDE